MSMAAVLTVMGLQIYKTILTDEEYQVMMDNIYDARDLVKKFDLDAAKRSLN